MHSTVAGPRGPSEIVEIGRKRLCDCDDTDEAQAVEATYAHDRCTAMPSMYQKYPASSSRTGQHELDGPVAIARRGHGTSRVREPTTRRRCVTEQVALFVSSFVCE
jgi:hypothetical protein